MTLDELVYQIDGKLVLEKIENEDKTRSFRLKLVDKQESAVEIKIPQENSRPPFADAVFTGKTSREALTHMVVSIRGKVITYDVLTGEQKLRVPRSLVPGNPKDLLPKVGDKVYALGRWDVSGYRVVRHGHSGTIFGVLDNGLQHLQNEQLLVTYWSHLEDIPRHLWKNPV